jgi:hypothetical protein
MPHRAFSLEEVATYLHLNVADVEELVKYHEIPFVMRGGALYSNVARSMPGPPSASSVCRRIGSRSTIRRRCAARARFSPTAP